MRTKPAKRPATPTPKKPKNARPEKKNSKKSAPLNSSAKYLFRLYVAGDSARSKAAVLRARQLCDAELSGNYELKVIDIYKQPILAREGQILATPTLVKECPPPVRRLIGTLTNITGLCVGLDPAGPDKAVL